MQEIIILKGIPASGKSSFAKELLRNNPEKYKRINKDDLRGMLDDSKWTPDNEKFIIETRDYLIQQGLKKGYSILADDTNLLPKHENKIREIAQNYCDYSNNPISFQIKWFHIDKKEATERDKGRIGKAQVGTKVIEDMYDSYLKVKNKKDSITILYPSTNIIGSQNSELPKVVLCDLDGTICKMVDRGPFEWHKVNLDEPKMPIIDLVNTLAKSDRKIIFFSGRDAVCREKTMAWLQNYFNFEIVLYMRKENDSRKDTFIKTELFMEHIKDKFFVDLILDDRDSVVNMWRNEFGITTLQVAPGNF